MSKVFFLLAGVLLVSGLPQFAVGALGSALIIFFLKK